MEFLSGYIKNIAVFLIFITLVGIISPSGKYKKYINLTMGFILIFVIIAPVSGMFKNNFDIDSLMVKMSYNPSLDEGVATQNQLIIKTYKEELQKQLEDLVKNNTDYQAEESFFDIDESEEGFGTIRKIVASLSKKSKPKKNKIIRIEKIVVAEPKEPEETQQDTEGVEIIKNLLSGFYNLSESNIHITIENTKE